MRVLVTGETEPGRGQDGAGPVRDGAGTVPETVHLLSALAELRERCGRAEGECTALRAQVIDLQAERDRLEAALAQTGPLTDAERRARQGLLSRQLTLR